MPATPVVVAAESQLTRTAFSDALASAGFDVLAGTESQEETLEALTDYDPAVVVVAGTILEAERSLVPIAEASGAAVVLVGSPEDGSAVADRVVPLDSERSLAVLHEVEPVVTAVQHAALGQADHREWLAEDEETPEDAAVLPMDGMETPGVPTLLVGASTGGPSLVKELLARLPRRADFRGVVVQHIRDGFGGRLAQRIDAGSEYDVVVAGDGMEVGPGTIAVARPGTHLELAVDRGRSMVVETTDDAPIHGVKPAIDPAFRTAADVVEGALVAVQLTGMGEDGAEGVRAVAEAGGTVIVQDPEEATVASMPESARATGVVDHVVAFEALAETVLDSVTVEV